MKEVYLCEDCALNGGKLGDYFQGFFVERELNWVYKEEVRVKEDDL